VAGLLGQIGLDLVLIAVSLGSALPLEAALHRRTDAWWRSQNQWLREARRDLDACGRECAGPVAVMGSIPPNLALVYLERRGYVLGPDLTSPLGATQFESFDEAVRFLDSHRVRVLVLRSRVMEKLPQKDLHRDFVAVDEAGEGYVYVRRSG